MESKQNNIAVSVCFLTHNHENYIRKSLDCILAQKVNFNYEIIIHDDASTDSTTCIVREYAEKYPDIIVPIIQTENQYRKQDILKTFVNPLVRGEYFALCEADDYWPDEEKLQLQYDYMQSHPECAMCVHNTQYIDKEGTVLPQVFNEAGKDYDITPEEAIKDYGGILFHTSSYFCRSEVYKAMPAPFYILNLYDYPIAIYMALCGPIHYIDRVMSRYRVGDPSSWTGQNFSEKRKRIEHNELMTDFLKGLDEYTEGKYSEAFNARIKDYTYLSLLLDGKTGAILRDRDFRRRYLMNNIIRPVIRRIRNFI